MKKHVFLLLFLGLIPLLSKEQGTASRAVMPRMRVIVDNDFNGDPDGLFQLVHLLLSPSVEVRAVIGSRLGDFDPSTTQADDAVKKATEVLKLLKMAGKVPVLAGANLPMPNDSTPVSSAGAEFIRQEALRTDTQLPLYVLCGGSLTQIASAALLAPSIADKLTLVWIGGPEYPDLALPPPGPVKIEFNTATDLGAARAVFNRTRLPLWQVPRDAYRQLLLPHSQLVTRVKSRGRMGTYLYNTLEAFTAMLGSQLHENTGETYILGDSPLVLLTALQSSMDADPSSSRYVRRQAPTLNAHGTYDANPSGRLIRVYTYLDSNLLFNDFFAKLEMQRN
ncbi:nucleoside hydrolase [Hymenobacter jejuensis]|uniref:Nucleoside hydrolase n=1 Tax=Hymenobacter jejuensis TaxID=2502781 RepID=A0A5B8A6M5_9BACT|nr:nucleoside hydrolase [Hymenobacter jejuensis]QDA62356.1 nucleoside hydrolase [Hymenobacter jejuensis]